MMPEFPLLENPESCLTGCWIKSECVVRDVYKRQDMNRANEARDMTKKLAALAEKYQCAIVLVGHMNKAAGNKAAYRGLSLIHI